MPRRKHGYKNKKRAPNMHSDESESDSTSDSEGVNSVASDDEFYSKLKPAPVPYVCIKNRVVIIKAKSEPDLHNLPDSTVNTPYLKPGNDNEVNTHITSSFFQK